MENFVKGLKNKKKLKQLNLNLCDTELGKDTKNMKLFSESFRILENLEDLNLILGFNNLGVNDSNLKYLACLLEYV